MGQWCIQQQSRTGKQGRAVSILEREQMAQEISKIKEILDPDINDSDPQPNVNTMESRNENHLMLYSVGHETITRKTCKASEEVPFKHTLQLLGPNC